MSWNPALDPQCPTGDDVDAIETLIVPRARDLGAFEVRRALPAPRRQMVGPFIFLSQVQKNPIVSSSPRDTEAGHRGTSGTQAASVISHSFVGFPVVLCIETQPNPEAQPREIKRDWTDRGQVAPAILQRSTSGIRVNQFARAEPT